MKAKQPFIIDKVTLRIIKAGHILVENKKYYFGKERITYVEHGVYAFIHFHDVCFDYNFSITENILREIDQIQKSEHPLFAHDFNKAIYREFFVLSELEIAFDFFEKLPMAFKSKSDLINMFPEATCNPRNPSVYTSDYRRKLKTVPREITLENGTRRVVNAKCTREILKSFMCYYDKAAEQKLKVVFWKRFELRFTSARYLKVATIEDLDLPILEFAAKIQPFMIKKVKLRLKSRAFLFVQYKYIKQCYPYLYKVFKEAGIKVPTTPPNSMQKLCN